MSINYKTEYKVGFVEIPYVNEDLTELKKKVLNFILEKRSIQSSITIEKESEEMYFRLNICIAITIALPGFTFLP